MLLWCSKWNKVVKALMICQETHARSWRLMAWVGTTAWPIHKRGWTIPGFWVNIDWLNSVVLCLKHSYQLPEAVVRIQWDTTGSSGPGSMSTVPWQSHNALLTPGKWKLPQTSGLLWTCTQLGCALSQANWKAGQYPLQAFSVGRSRCQPLCVQDCPCLLSSPAS